MCLFVAWQEEGEDPFPAVAPGANRTESGQNGKCLTHPLTGLAKVDEDENSTLISDLTFVGPFAVFAPTTKAFEDLPDALAAPAH